MASPPPLPSGPSPTFISGLSCSSCGGSIEVQEGWTNLKCRYCGTGLAVIGELGITRVMVLNKFDRTAASSAVHRWLGRGFKKDPALKKEACFEEAFLAWFPFTRLRLDLIGWVLGKMRNDFNKGAEWSPIERELEEHIDLTGPAADMAEFGVSRINLQADEILPLREELLRSRGMLFRPNHTPDEIAHMMAEKAMQDAVEKIKVDKPTFSWFATLRRKIALVYYPLWVFRYSFRGRIYQVLIDAEDGALAYGKAPGNHFYRASCLVLAAAASCFIGTTLLQNFTTLFRAKEGLVFVGILGLVLGGIFLYGYSQFRHGGVVEEGSGLAEEKGVTDTITTLEKVFGE